MLKVVPRLFGLGSLESGSNAWVVDSSKSVSGKPLLANDPHLAIPAPSRWYEAHLSAPGWNVAGVMVPGTPVIIIGHNNQIAWGLTNAMIDDADFYNELVDSSHSDMYRFEKRSLPFQTREEKIYIAPSDSLIITLRETHYGLRLSTMFILELATMIHCNIRRHRLQCAGTGFEISDEIYGFYLMDKATTYNEFENGDAKLPFRHNLLFTETFTTPSGIGQPAKYRSGEKEILCFRSTDGTANRNGKVFLHSISFRTAKNPANGYLACANQKISNQSFYFSTLWEPPSRNHSHPSASFFCRKIFFDGFRTIPARHNISLCTGYYSLSFERI